MGLFRLLFRAFFAPPRPVPQREYGPVARIDPAPQAAAPVEPAVALVTVLRGPCYVIDGDTIAIGQNMIRLAGIDAPELDQPYGKNAKWALVKLCKGQVVEAVFEGNQSYTREVATCYLPDGRDLSAEMVRLGLALDWRKFSGGKYRALETRDARRRLWRADARQKGRFPPVPRT